MSQPVPKTNPPSYSTIGNIRVPVIASHSARGGCVPVYFQYPLADGSCQTVRIDRIVSQQEHGASGTSFVCDVTVDDCKVRVSMYYHLNRGYWSMRVLG